jgi:hypothetical protein
MAFGEDCLELPNDGKVITVRAQTDVNRGTFVGPAANERAYDVAGAAHVPESISLLRYVGQEAQNPADWEPIAKALLHHLIVWIALGTPPPEPLHLEGDFLESGQFELRTDQDGNALGGIRLPHMPSFTPAGEEAGAPLGIYGGADLDFQDPALGGGFAFLGGTFAPFPPEEIIRRYPTREVYVELVRRAAATLWEQGFILEEDYTGYIREAERYPLYQP